MENIMKETSLLERTGVRNQSCIKQYTDIR